MKYQKLLVLLPVLAGLAMIPGCARAARDTAGFAIENTLTVEKPFEEAWQIVKSVLREEELELYTRDKRGTFVAYSKMRRNLLLQPHRVKYTIEIGPLSEEETSIYIQTVRQVYGVTLLTYPGWHDRKTEGATRTQEIIAAIEAKAAAPEG
jgi:hypothetical protein